MPVDCLVGLQWGSEGKGKIAALLADNYDVAVRSGGPNSGHTVWLDGKKYVTRHVPCAWVNPNCELLISSGAAIDVEVLLAEIAALPEAFNVKHRLWVDPHAVIIQTGHKEYEEDIAASISSTQHGVGAAYMGKIGRKPRHTLLANDLDFTGTYGINLRRTSTRLHELLKVGARVMIEGTQGTLLSLDHGDWPYVTGRNVIASQLMADAGLGPHEVRDVIGVGRTYPIRVGGPSGPLPGEITWDELSRLTGREIKPETTTVTGKIRRIARIDWELLQYAARLNGVTQAWVTFSDYLDSSPVTSENEGFFRRFQHTVECPVVGHSFGPTQQETQTWSSA